jgi:hypothetical protein
LGKKESDSIFHVHVVERVLILLFALVLNLDASATAAASDWPDGLVLHGDSTSPDGHYGILVATLSHVDDGTTYLIAEEGEDFGESARMAPLPLRTRLDFCALLL